MRWQPTFQRRRAQIDPRQSPAQRRDASLHPASIVQFECRCWPVIGGVGSGRNTNHMHVIDVIDAFHLLQHLVNLRQIQRATKRPSVPLRTATQPRIKILPQFFDRPISRLGPNVLGRIGPYVDLRADRDP